MRREPCEALLNKLEVTMILLQNKVLSVSSFFVLAERQIKDGLSRRIEKDPNFFAVQFLYSIYLQIWIFICAELISGLCTTSQEGAAASN